MVVPSNDTTVLWSGSRSASTTLKLDIGRSRPMICAATRARPASSVPRTASKPWKPELKEMYAMKRSLVFSLIAVLAVAMLAVGCKKEEATTDTAATDTSMTTGATDGTYTTDTTGTTGTMTTTDTAATGTTGTGTTTDTSATGTVSTTTTY